VKDDVFLNLFVDFTSGLQAGGGAVRANVGSWDWHNVVNMVREGAVPRRVTMGSPAFAFFRGLARRALGLEREAC